MTAFRAASTSLEGYYQEWQGVETVNGDGHRVDFVVWLICYESLQVSDLLRATCQLNDNKSTGNASSSPLRIRHCRYLFSHADWFMTMDSDEVPEIWQG